MHKIKMTEMQKAYYVGRENNGDGTTGTHLYVEILFRGTPTDLEDALNKVISSQRSYIWLHLKNHLMDIIIGEILLQMLTTLILKEIMSPFLKKKIFFNGLIVLMRN